MLLQTYIQNDIESALANFLINYPVEEIEGNFDKFPLGNDLDRLDIFGEFDEQEHILTKHENDYLEYDNMFLSEQRCIEDFDLTFLTFGDQINAQTEEIQYSMPMDYQVKMETVSHEVLFSLLNSQLYACFNFSLTEYFLCWSLCCRLTLADVSGCSRFKIQYFLTRSITMLFRNIQFIISLIQLFIIKWSTIQIKAWT